MTQPPNAPGPYGPPNGGWQQQPGSYQQPGGHPQQGPGYGPPQQGYGGPGYGGPGYGGPGYGYGPGGPGGPRRQRTIMYVVLAVIAVLVVIAAVGLVVARSGNDDDQSGPTPPSTAAGQPTVSPEASETQPSAPEARLAEAGQLATKFLTFLNANDQKHAAALGCEETKKLLPGVILLAIDPPTKLTVSGPAVALGATSNDAYYQNLLSVPFAGTTKHNPATGAVTVMDVPPRPLCVRLMQLKLG
ncbi:hypothetical protein AB0L70_02605 [Kribbella sp. NPDC051952]|uniref:hypothetical protein n=1 Tax=Kribbella sp. NPDC051952 TaxID=3154851 RepID=UPI0034362BE7